jgi:hypothetical protein
MFPTWVTIWINAVNQFKNSAATKDFIGDDEYVAGYPPWIATSYIEGARMKRREDAECLLFLLRAIEDGDAQKVRDLLGQGIKGNLSLGPAEGTLLKFAAENTRNPECLQLLLDAAANGKDPDTLVTLAARGKGETLLSLAGRGVDLDARTKDGSTPLSAAIGLASLETIKKLRIELGNFNLIP